MDIITSTWTELLQQFFPVFTTPGAEIFSQLMVGWILCTTRRTVTGILPFADPSAKRAHDAYHRFFPDARWSLAKLWQLLATILIQAFCRNGIITLALDDTLFHHTGRKINGAGWWRDAVRSTKKSTVYAWGLNLVILTVQIQPPWDGKPLGLPINIRVHRKDGPTLIELAVEMINEVRQWLPKRLFRVVADGFYATLAGRPLEAVGLISRIKRNATMYDLPPKQKKKQRGRPRKKGEKLPKLQKMAAHIRNWDLVTFRRRGKTVKRLVYSRAVLWYAVSSKPILLVISRDPSGKEEDDFLFTTDVMMDPAEALGCYADRWSVEQTIKNTKQHLGGQEPQTWKGRGPERAVGLSLWLYSMVWLWYLRHKSKRRCFLVRPWYPQKATPSFVDALSCLRRELWQDRIKFMFEKIAVHNKKSTELDKNFEFLIEALASAA